MDTERDEREEWTDEWVYDGRNCRIVFNNGRHYCGYAQTPLRFSYSDATGIIDIHGGLTYGVDEDGWLGFDCAHSYDVCFHPDTNEVTCGKHYLDAEHGRAWHPSDVKEETELLADRLSKVESFVQVVTGDW